MIRFRCVYIMISGEMVVSPKQGEPQCRPQNTTVLIMGTPKMVPLIMGNPQIKFGSSGLRVSQSRFSVVKHWGFRFEGFGMLHPQP